MACVGDDSNPLTDGGPKDTSTTNDVVTTDSGGDAPLDVMSCDGSVCGSSCVDLQSDDGNCGTCGHSCGGDGCVKGMCKPSDLITGLDFPTSLAQNAKFPSIYVRAGNNVYICAKTGCGNSAAPMWNNATTYATKTTSPIAVSTLDLAADVFDTGNIEHYGYMGAGNAGQALTPQNMPGGGSIQQMVAFPDDKWVVYMWAYGVFRCDGANCAPSQGVMMAGEDGETAVAVQGGSTGYVIWNTYNNIHYCTKTAAASCATTNLLTAPSSQTASIKFMAASDTTLYWAVPNSTKFQVYACPFPQGCSVPKLLADNEDAVDGFAADDNGVYWTQSAFAKVRGCLDAKNGCGTNSITLATNQATPVGIAIDPKYVFWSQKAASAGQGKVTRMAR